METTNKLKDINEVLEFLYSEFPQCFKQKDGIKPLKVGIFKDIAEKIEGSDKVSKTQVRQALRKYTSSWRYLEAVTKNEFRVDLEGGQAEKVEQEHVEHAQKALEESRAKMAKRKKQQRPRNDGDTKSYKSKGPGQARHANKKPRVNKKPAQQQQRRSSGKVEPLPANEVKVNNKVKVKLGQALVNATITEVNKDEVHVELVTGMQVKTKADSLFIL
ncbi:RNA chaperone ProQ [Pseudoalteromonas luteoviolacea]|uniref:RNA chaperone ProQ n=1 Tax=Pseudoalteromonas luteoviolacea H33 TaxID=1365251 RepID=A0A167FGM6_9GAMM|nr:RNA chaperone ProQ [Pseudoalteromonas luteoviolacea]KZN52262.1 ABC transporter substrate-binding protein [Pseudoalteromonas luteoviolacea H33]KZN77103.1 ABC transporter substrate-binding protein [Pseudoalteromonas luteoviolacea H33-S]MBQ4877279.1 RNA chaperone ProQ [Pseudoalteromonas luteoviolacea]MBQ4906140.1 RNA chaperone ProQ [Pseudoalteromonas luteoviolacea]